VGLEIPLAQLQAKEAQPETVQDLQALVAVVAVAQVVQVLLPQEAQAVMEG